MSKQAIFHLALPVTDLRTAEDFYCGLLECNKGRQAERWLDLDFFGHQLVLQLVDTPLADMHHNEVDRDQIPARHYGAVLPMDDWHALASKLEAAGVDFLLKPKIRFAGEVGEQATLFIRDPSGNALEFKSFADPARLFAIDESSDESS